MGRREGGEVAINTAVLTFWVIAIGIPQSVNNPFPRSLPPSLSPPLSQRKGAKREEDAKKS